jgi:hypothetical protein
VLAIRSSATSAHRHLDLVTCKIHRRPVVDLAQWRLLPGRLLVRRRDWPCPHLPGPGSSSESHPSRSRAPSGLCRFVNVTQPGRDPVKPPAD